MVDSGGEAMVIVPPSARAMPCGAAAGSTSIIAKEGSYIGAVAVCRVARHASALSAGTGPASVVPSGICTTSPERVRATTASSAGSVP